MKTLFTLFAAAGLAGAALAVPKWTKPQQEVADIFKAWADAELAGNIDREMSLFTPSFTMWDLSTAAPIDYATVRQQTAEIFKQSKVTACVIEPDSIHIEGAAAVVHGHYTESMKDKAGVSTDVGGPWSAFLTRNKGEWRVAGLSYVSQPPPGTAPIPAAANTAAAEKQNVLDQFAALDAQDYKRYRELMPEDAVIHIVGAPEPFKREALIAFIQDYWKAFPDTAHTIREAVVEGDTVVLHVTCQGTHRGTYEGVAPTGKTIHYDGVHIVRFQQGRVHDWWIMDDSLGLMQQLGLQLTPAPATVPAQPANPADAAPEMKRLDVWYGEWNYAGEYYKTPLGDAAKFTGTMSGRPTLKGNVAEFINREKSPGETEALELCWFDPAAKKFAYVYLGNDGYSESGPFTMTTDLCTWEGTGVAGGTAFRIRGTEKVSPDQRMLTRKTELSVDGKTWLPFFDSIFTKVAAKP
ncbi:MAG TPA: ester cyclase [Lacunisphaera sp.]|nr:ester cyclase [Lacunisphaera sp.]